MSSGWFAKTLFRVSAVEVVESSPSAARWDREVGLGLSFPSELRPTWRDGTRLASVADGGEDPIKHLIYSSGSEQLKVSPVAVTF